jgi:Domain of unknown function (DUF4136)
MRIHFFAALLLGTCLSGCTATIPSVDVTRFHLGQAIAPAPVSVTPQAGQDGTSIEYRTWAIAVARELGKLGFTEGSNAAYVAEISYSRDSRITAPARSPVTIGVGGGTGGGGFGIGVGTTFGVGTPKTSEAITTRLSVKLKRKSDGAALWEGRAQTEAPSTAPAAQPGLASEKLTRALFTGFPGESGKTVTVP